MNTRTDQELLREFADTRSETAFAELVRRHVDLVHSAALRMLADTDQAKDVTQGVFMAVAQSANELVHHPVLSGWLHRTARNLAANVVRTNVRRQRREQEAAAMNELLSTGPDASWEHIAPHLDAALGSLSDSDRDAVMLRYFEKKSAAEMATVLGINDAAAQKRVNRAVERLREFFANRGVTIGTGGLVAVVTANAVQAAPLGLAATISVAALAGTAATTSTLIAATTKTIAMTTLQKTLVTATVAVLAGAGTYQAKQAHYARAQVQTLQQQQAPLTDQIQRLQNERDNATNRAVALAEELADMRKRNSDLLRLRSEVTALRQQLDQANASVRTGRVMDIVNANHAGLEAVRQEWFRQLEARRKQKAKVDQLAIDLQVPIEIITNSTAISEQKDYVARSPYRDYLIEVENRDSLERFSKVLATRIRSEIINCGLPASEGSYLDEE